MIDFNDACRYQNFLKMKLTEACTCLRDNDFVATTVKVHHKSDANKNASDEMEHSTNDLIDLGITPDKMIQFIMDLLAERSALSEAIAKAKAEADLQIDSACMKNKDKQFVSTYLNQLVNMKTRETEGQSTGYAMNEVDGKQTSYIYKTTTVKKINFDRNMVKGIANRLSREMKDTSKEIERYNLDVQVDFEPRWSEDDSIEDILSA